MMKVSGPKSVAPALNVPGHLRKEDRVPRLMYPPRASWASIKAVSKIGDAGDVEPWKLLVPRVVSATTRQYQKLERHLKIFEIY